MYKVALTEAIIKTVELIMPCFFNFNCVNRGTTFQVQIHYFMPPEEMKSFYKSSI